MFNPDLTWLDLLVTSWQYISVAICVNNCKHLYSCMTTEVSTAASMLEVLDHRSISFVKYHPDAVRDGVA